MFRAAELAADGGASDSGKLVENTEWWLVAAVFVGEAKRLSGRMWSKLYIHRKKK